MNQEQENFDKLFRKELENVKFEIPDEHLKHLFPIWIQIMDISSLEELQCDYKTHESITNEIYSAEIPNFNLWNVSFLLNTFTRCSPFELGISLGRYSEIGINYNNELSVLWNEIVMPIRQKLMKKLKTQAVLTAPKNGMKVIPNGRR